MSKAHNSLEISSEFDLIGTLHKYQLTNEIIEKSQRFVLIGLGVSETPANNGEEFDTKS
jgi:hypothetical protein